MFIDVLKIIRFGLRKPISPYDLCTSMYKKTNKCYSDIMYSNYSNVPFETISVQIIYHTADRFRVIRKCILKSDAQYILLPYKFLFSEYKKKVSLSYTIYI